MYKYDASKEEIEKATEELSEFYTTKIQKKAQVDIDFVVGDEIIGSMFLFSFFIPGISGSIEQTYHFKDHPTFLIQGNMTAKLPMKEFVDDCKDTWEDFVPKIMRA